MNKPSYPELREWMNPTQIGEELGITRQSANRMIRGGDFKTVHVIGSYYVVKRWEVERLKKKRAA